MSIKDMPCVTVEQVLTLRKAAIKLEQELADLKASMPKVRADTVRRMVESMDYGYVQTDEGVFAYYEDTILGYADKLETGDDSDYPINIIHELKSDKHFWVSELAKTLTIDTLPEQPSWNELLGAVAKLVEDRNRAISKRPSKSAWVPEVGVECEYNHPLRGWVRCTTIGWFRNKMVCAPVCGGFYMGSNEQYRP